MTDKPSTRAHRIIMTFAGTDKDFGVGGLTLEADLIRNGWTRYVRNTHMDRNVAHPLMRLTEQAEQYAQKEKAWLSRGNVA